MLFERTAPSAPVVASASPASAAVRANRESLLHRFLLFTHRWAGILLGVPILILALTGAALVFEEWVDVTLNPQLRVVTPQATRATLHDMANTVRAAYPEATLFEIRDNADPARATNAYLRTANGFLVVFLDQYQGTIKGHRGNLNTPMMFIHRLHTGRTFGPWGQIAAGVCTLVALFGVLGGLYLWWPRKTWTVKAGVGWRRQNFDLHSVLGIFSSLVLVFTLASGAIITWDAEVEHFLVRWLDGLEQPPRPARLESTPIPGGTRLTLDEAVAIAERTLPGTQMVGINVPANDKVTYGVGRRFPEDKTGGGRSAVTIDQFSGEVLRVINSRELPIGTKIMNYNETTHVGAVLGWPTIVLTFLATVALAGQVVTGFLIWWKPKRRKTGSSAAAVAG